MNLGLNKENFNNIDKRLETITKQKVEQIEINTELPPTTNNLTDSNKLKSSGGIVAICVSHMTLPI